METLNYLGNTIHRWEIGGSTFLAWPEAGARLMHWHHNRADGSIREVIHWPDLSELSDPVASIRGGNPVLFPFSARSFDQGDIHHWRDLQGNRRKMPMHGFARQGTFRIDRADNAGFKAILEPTAQDHACYPYDYEFSVTYRFESHRLTCEYALRNLGTTPLPWSAGHHFYFAAPWTDDASRDDYILQLPAGDTVRQTPVGTLTPGPKVPRQGPLSNPDLVDTIHVGLAGNRVRFGPADGSEFTTVSIGTSAKPRPDDTIVTWTSSPDAPYYCVEPWMGPPNAPGHGRGLHLVPAGETARFTVTVEIG